jgi:hypothetical protein
MIQRTGKAAKSARLRDARRLGARRIWAPHNQAERQVDTDDLPDAVEADVGVRPILDIDSAFERQPWPVNSLGAVHIPHGMSRYEPRASPCLVVPAMVLDDAIANFAKAFF